MTISVTQADIDASSGGQLTNSLSTAINRLNPGCTAVTFVDPLNVPPAKAVVCGLPYSIDNPVAAINVLVENTLGWKPSGPYTTNLTAL